MPDAVVERGIRALELVGKCPNAGAVDRQIAAAPAHPVHANVCRQLIVEKRVGAIDQAALLPFAIPLARPDLQRHQQPRLAAARRRPVRKNSHLPRPLELPLPALQVQLQPGLADLRHEIIPAVNVAVNVDLLGFGVAARIDRPREFGDPG